MNRQRWRFSSRWCGVIIGLLAAVPARASEPPTKGQEGAGATIGHPIVAGYERFHADRPTDPARGGRLLLGELGCLACHTPSAARQHHLERKQAPILDAVGSRVKPAYLRRFLADPGGTKPGTTMPDLLGGLPEAERKDAVEALTHLLASTGSVNESNPIPRAIGRGRVVYERVGCLACHDKREVSPGPMATSVPLGDLAGKYTIASLAAFLADPLKVRPSGRMPALSLTRDEPTDLANYLLRDILGQVAPNLSYRYYEGRWEKLPNFAELKPTATGLVSGLDLSVARRRNNFALEFEGYLRIDGAGKYTFHIESDDGSRLTIDGMTVVDNDGIHPPQEVTAAVELTKGMHRIVASVFNGGGDAELIVDYEGPRLVRQPISPDLYLTEDLPAPSTGKVADRFVLNPELVEKGRGVFARVGCASCHQLRQSGRAIASRLESPALDALRPEGGCLEPSGSSSVPRYHLASGQRNALATAIRTLGDLPGLEPTPTETVGRLFTAFNCYACHQRGGIGGVEPARDAFFQTTQKEMGDEGRLPPPLDGVGAKLTSGYLKRLFNNGAKDRPYMLTRMPRFGESNLGGAIASLESLDPLEPMPAIALHEPPRKVKSAGRYLAGGEALGCIKCHNFNGVKAEGVQAIDMTVMTTRLRHDWFHRYLLDPQAYRPGTRMPGGWPMGKSLVPQVLEGNTQAQIEAIWTFLSDGTQATEPYGLGRNPIPIIPDREPVVYRNFIRGAGPRAIGVGYPERANLAFDANTMRIALIWQGAFIDAARHWSGRGEGFQGPLGDNVLSLPEGPSFARLDTGSDPWPELRPKEAGFRFRGYRLDSKGRPSFLYNIDQTHVVDTPEPVGAKPAGLRRTLTLIADNPRPDLWFRAAVADTIERREESWYLINGEWKLRIESTAEPVIRKSGGKTELLVPVAFKGHEARIVEEFAW